MTPFFLRASRVGLAALAFSAAAIVPSTTTGVPKCDPFTEEIPVPVPARLARRCGNGRVDTFATSCSRVCLRGCGVNEPCGIRCEEQAELCDGAAVTSCEELGFAGGRSACRAACDAVDLRGCDPCFASAQVTCGEMRLPALRSVGTPRAAARSGDIGIVFTARAAPNGPSVFFTVLEPDLRVRLPARGLASTNIVPSIAATPAGYLLASFEGEVVSIRLADARRPTAPVTWSRTGRYELVDLATTPAGEPILVTVRNYPRGVEARLLDARGVPRPFPDVPLSATSQFGRVIVVPLHAGALTAPAASIVTPEGASLATRDGDHLVVWIRSQPHGCGTSGCWLGAAIDRAGTSDVGFAVFDLGDGTLADLPLPGGARLTLAQQGSQFRDVYTAAGVAPLELSGTLAPGPANAVFGGVELYSPMFVPTAPGFFGVTVFEAMASWGEGGAAGAVPGQARLVFARVRP